MLSDKPLIKLPEMLEITRSSKSRTYQSIKEKTFPAPIKHGRSSYWLRAEVLAWIEQRAAERNKVNGGAK